MVYVEFWNDTAQLRWLDVLFKPLGHPKLVVCGVEDINYPLYR